jgi:hypothetical protein
MDFINKIKVRLKPSRAENPAKQIKIEVREKDTYVCQNCHNKYETNHYYCPQCLGEIRSAGNKRFALRILSIQKEKLEALIRLLEYLSGKKEFPFSKMLSALPWTMINNSDPATLFHWKDVLECEKVEVGIDEMGLRRSSGLLRNREPLFSETAPLPYFSSKSTDQSIRVVAKSMKNIAVRLKWIDAVLSSYSILENFYKRNPNGRVLFSDYVFTIDQDLQESSRDYFTYYKVREEEFLKVIERLQTKFDQMREEIEAVKQQVEQQL